MRTKTESTRRTLLGGVLLATVLMSSASMLVFPLLPALQDSLGISTGAIGLMAAAGFAAALVAELLVAPFADRGAARWMATGGVLLMAAALGASAFAVDAWQLVGARAIGGFGFGIFLAAASALLVRVAPARAGESLGRLSAAELAGVSIGPLASGVAVAFASPQLILGVAGAVVLTALAPVLMTFREPATASAGATTDPTDTTGKRISLDLLRSPQVLGIVLLYSAVMIPNGAYDGIWPRFMTDIGADAWLLALSYILFAIPYILVAGYAGRLADRIGGVPVFVRGLIMLVPFIVLYGVIGNPWVATGMGFAESSGQAFAFIGAAAAMAHAVSPARAGASQGLMRAAGLLAATAAAAASGFGYDAGGPLALFGGTAITVIVVAGIGVLFTRRRSQDAKSGDADRAASLRPAGSSHCS
jgi:MFS family permease